MLLLYIHLTQHVKSACRENRSHWAFINSVHLLTGFIR
nr:MAG TPA: hypothetical protein [Caudoviricetes sp.]